MSKLTTFTNGIIKENPVLVLVLGTCPTLAVTTSMENAIGMGIAATVVLMGSNVFISLLKKIIPDKVRIPSYITIIAGFVTIVSLLLEAYLPALHSNLGIFLPLIVVNCIILGRAEMFANKNTVLDSLLDAIGMGIGFTFALACMALIREPLGSGTLLGMQILPSTIPPIMAMKLAPGGFFTFGLIIAIVNKVTKGRALKKRASMGCAGCPGAAACGATEKEVG